MENRVHVDRGQPSEESGSQHGAFDADIHNSRAFHSTSRKVHRGLTRCYRNRGCDHTCDDNQRRVLGYANQHDRPEHYGDYEYDDSEFFVRS